MNSGANRGPARGRARTSGGRGEFPAGEPPGRVFSEAPAPNADASSRFVRYIRGGDLQRRGRIMASDGPAGGLTPEEMERFESLLMDRRRVLLSDLQALEDADARSVSETSAVSSHLADLGSDREASDISLGMRASESTEVREI